MNQVDALHRMTSQDLFLVIGIVLLAFSLPAILGALADRRSPRAASVVILVGGSLVLLALSQKPGGYTWAGVPDAFVRVVAHFIR